jgi:hypothetical protein
VLPFEVSAAVLRLTRKDVRIAGCLHVEPSQGLHDQRQYHDSDLDRHVQQCCFADGQWELFARH